MLHGKAFQYDEFVSNVKHSIKKIRCNAIDELEKFSCNDVSKLCTRDENYMKILIELLNDEAEICRKKSLKLILSYVEAQKLIEDELFTTILLTVERRIGTEIIEECSEEIRCLLLRVLSLSIEKSRNGSVEGFIENTMNIVLNSLNDPNSEVKRCGLDLVVKGANKFANLFNRYSDKVVTCLLSCTKHKHFRVRSQSVDALGVILVYCSKDVISHVCCSLVECLLDHNVNVRICVLRASAHWLQVLPDRYSYAYCLLPLILSSLLDESTKCREEGYDLWNKIGLKYLENEKAKIQQRNFQLPKRILQLQLDVQIPNDGCSALIQKELDKILPTVIATLDDWKNEVRTKSTALLKIVVVHAGLSIVPFLNLLIPAILKKCCDQDRTVSKHATEIAQFIGCIVPAAVYWKVFITHWKNGFTLNHLILLASLLKMGEEKEIYEMTNEVVCLFVDNQTYTREGADDRKYKLEIFSKLLHCCDGRKLNATTAYNVYKILLSTMAMAVDECEESEAFELIERFCSTSEFQSTVRLNEHYFGALFAHLSETCSIWEAHSTDLKIFIASLRTFTDDVFTFSAETFTRICEIILHFEFDEEVKFRTLLTIAQLIENDQLDVNKHFKVMEAILLGPLRQLLIWRSGKVVQVIRNAALTVVNLCVQRIHVLPVAFIEEFTPSFSSLCEDEYLDTRKTALCALAHCCRHLQTKNVEFEFFVKMLAAAVMRLEDETVQIRLMAILAIKEIFFTSHVVQIDKSSPKFDQIYKLLEIMVVMSSDENIEIRNALRDLLKHRTTSDLLKRLNLEGKLDLLISKCSDNDFVLTLKTDEKI